jgi:hypothetical protein
MNPDRKACVQGGLQPNPARVFKDFGLPICADQGQLVGKVFSFSLDDRSIGPLFGEQDLAFTHLHTVIWLKRPVPSSFEGFNYHMALQGISERGGSTVNKEYEHRPLGRGAAPAARQGFAPQIRSR